MPDGGGGSYEKRVIVWKVKEEVHGGRMVLKRGLQDIDQGAFIAGGSILSWLSYASESFS
jgi:hypothetical protein